MYERIELALETEKAILYISLANGITSKFKEVLLPPSEINHDIELNASNHPRRAIAFNHFVNDKLGNYKDVSELHL